MSRIICVYISFALGLIANTKQRKRVVEYRLKRDSELNQKV